MDHDALPERRRRAERLRQVAGALLLLAGLPVLTAVLVADRQHLDYATPVLLVLALVAAAASLGGLRVGLPGAVAGAGVIDVAFTRPFGSLHVRDPEQLLVLGVFVVTAVGLSAVVQRAADASAAARRAAAEAAALASLAGTALAEQATLPGVLHRVRTLLSAREVVLLERVDEQWRTVERDGAAGPAVDERVLQVPVGDHARLEVRGPQVFAEDRRVLTAFADVAGAALAGRRLAARAEEAAQLEAVDRARTALLAAAGHDLRTPLAGIKAAASSLRADDVGWSDKERAELLATVEEGADRMQALVDDLLDASRLEAGAVTALRAPVSLEEVLDGALQGLPDVGRVHLEVPEALPDLLVDGALVERVLANLLSNALRHSPAGTLVTVRADARGGVVRCDVVDHGPGLPGDRWPDAVTSLRRAGDRGRGGLGLGLVVARGLAEATGVGLQPSTTPGGGCTVRVLLPVAP